MSRRRRFLLLWLAALLVSHTVWWLRDAPPLPPAGAELAERPDAGGGTRRIVFRDRPAREPGAATVVLVHGSPGRGADLAEVADALGDERRLLLPDLPGFGDSPTPAGPLSTTEHARDLLALLDACGIEQAHLVGYSMGGGVALELSALAPERVRSLTLLGSIGVQELELFGSRRLNHAVHLAQLLGLNLVRWATPHFGLADRLPLDTAFARNFADTDQRPMRGMLLAWGGPALVLHGDQDFLVPVEAAREHARLMPQSRLELVPGGNHFLPWTAPAELADRLDTFLDEVDQGRAVTRAGAAPARARAATEPFDPAVVPSFTGAALLLAMLLIAAATLVSEDLTCIATGLLVAQGRIGFLAGSFGCFLGILFGDVLLYVLGRALGRGALARAPLRWWIRPAAVDRASAYFRRQGWRVVLACRFLPGLRVPTYFAAGALKTHFGWFLLYFVVAVTVWTPVLVGVSAWFGEGIAEAFDLVERYALAGMAAIALFLLLLLKLVVPLFSWRGRRGLVGAWKRKRHFEFWSRWALYLPLVPWFLLLALRYRGLRVVTAANPAIPTGGLCGESKSDILRGLGEGHPLVARWCLLPAAPGGGGDGEGRLAAARAFLEREGLSFPVVLKPDVGERGDGVEVVRDEDALRARLAADPAALILQEHVAGEEFGLFYLRPPGAERGRVSSVVEKRRATVTGDGRRSLEELILADPRAVALARTYAEANAARLDEVPAAGEEVLLGEIGAHCRGAVFLDAAHRLTPELEAAVDRLSRGFPGFHHGRYDVRVPDAAAFARGEGFRVIELNGLTAEPAHLYDRRHSVLHAWRTLASTWAAAWAAGRANLDRGARPASWADIAKALFRKD